MKNIFKTVNTKIFLLFLVTFLSNLSYGQRTYEQRLNDLYPGVYFASNPNYNHNTSRTSGSGISEYQEYDQYGDVYYFAIDWDTEALKIPTQNDYNAIYFSMINQQVNDAIYQSMLANLDSGFYLQALADGMRRGEISEERMFAYMQNSFNNMYIDTESNDPAVKSLQTFFTAVAIATKGLQEYHFGAVLDDSGNVIVTGKSTSFADSMFTTTGDYLDFKNNLAAITSQVWGLNDAQYDSLASDGEYWLKATYINSWTNFDHDKFATDTYQHYLEALASNGLTPPPFTIGASGAYGWNDGSAESFWNNYMPFTNSFYTFYTGAQTGDESQMAWGLFLMTLDWASFGEGSTGIKALDVGLDGLLHGAGNLFKVGDNIIGITVQQIKAGTNAKYAVIGRSMGNAEITGVRNVYSEIKNVLKQDVEIFDASSLTGVWKTKFDDALIEFSQKTNNWTTTLSNDELLQLKMYKLNKEWAQHLVDDGYTILDMGDFNNLGFSAFYSMEKLTIFK